MRHVLLPGLAAATALALVTVAPASAAPADTTTITHTVAAASVAPMTVNPNPFVDGMDATWGLWDSRGSIAPAGAIAFPHVVSDAAGADPDGDSGDVSYVDNVFLPPATPENCTRTVSSFSYSYDLLEVNSWHYDAVATFSALLSGVDADVAPMSDDSASTDGIGWLEYPVEAPGLVAHGLTSPYEEVMPLVGTVTMAYPAPVDAATAEAYVAFGFPFVSAWTLTDASFLVTDTCTTQKPVVVPPVVVPPVVTPPVVTPPVVTPPVVTPPVVTPPVVMPPVVVPPVVTPPVVTPPIVQPPVVVPSAVGVPAAAPAQPLADTGVEATAIAGVAALLFGAGAAVLLWGRRRATH